MSKESGRDTLLDISETPRALRLVAERYDELFGLGRELGGKGFARVFLTGCGSSYYAAALIAWPLIRGGWGGAVYAMPASELIHYYADSMGSRDLVVAVSRSGETAETLEALRRARGRGAHTVLISIAEKSRGRELVDTYIYINAGEERSMVMTKSFVSMTAAGLMVASGLSQGLGAPYTVRRSCVEDLAAFAERVVSERKALGIGRSYAEKGVQRFVYLAMGPGYPVALEASLKLKETSYVATEALHALEFRHGPMATVGEKQLIVVINQRGEGYEAVKRLYEELVSRGADVLRLSDDGGAGLELPATGCEEVTALAAILHLQLFAVGYATALGRNPDAPRNLVRFVERF